MLTLLLIMAMSCRGQSLVDSGMEFITVFPENVAYFYPFYPSDSLNITAFHNNTEVRIYFKSVLRNTIVLQQGQTENVPAPSDIEENIIGVSQKTIRLISTNNIVVLAISKQGDSVQTNVIPPMEKLDTFYSIPQLNYTEMLSKFSQATGSISARYSFFRLIVINAESLTNTVRLYRKSNQIEDYVLQPYTFVQLALDGSEILIDAYYRVAVLVSHPCLEATSCKCNMMLNQLRPDVQWGNSFVLPLQNITRWLHVTVNTLGTGNALVAGTLEPIQSGTQNVSTIYPVSLRFISTGLMFEVIPETMFAACYLVQFGDSNGNVSVIAETVNRTRVYKDGGLLTSVTWTEIPNTKYSVASVSLLDRHVIWHPSSKIAVYMFRNMTNGIQYGGPAIVLSEIPDPDGCAVQLPQTTIASTPMSWYESQLYCTSIYDELMSPSTVISRWALAEFLKNAADTEHWFGLRRSLLTLDWYWQKGNDTEGLNGMQWGTEEPSGTLMGMCAAVVSDTTWKSVPCCTSLMPICYTKPTYFLVKHSERH